MYESSSPNRGADRTIPEFKLNFIREEIKCKSVSVPFRLPILPSSMRSSSQSSRASRMKKAPSWLHCTSAGYLRLPADRSAEGDCTRSRCISRRGLRRFHVLFSVLAHSEGKYNISICLGTACYVKGADKVLDRLVAKLGIQPEECTPDGVFSLTACRCIGAAACAGPHRQRRRLRPSRSRGRG